MHRPILVWLRVVRRFVVISGRCAPGVSLFTCRVNTHLVRVSYTALARTRQPPQFQGETTEWNSGDSVPACLAWSDSDGGWKKDGIGVDTISAGGDGVANITCRTYHLSTFASSETAGISLDLVVEDFLTEFEVLQKVSCDATRSSRFALPSSCRSSFAVIYLLAELEVRHDSTHPVSFVLQSS